MMLIARIEASDETDERVLELAARVVELQQIQLGADDRAADVGAAILGGLEREQHAAALLVRIGDALHAVDRAEDLLDVGARLALLRGLALGLRLLIAVRVARLA